MPTATPARRALSLATGWLVDRKLPRAWRAPLYRAFARRFDLNLEEARGPLEIYPTLGAFFVRRLVDGARRFPADSKVLPSPCDGTVQDVSRIERGSLLQAKGHSYTLGELLAGADAGCELEGGTAWTIYLSPRDYHRVHCPLAGELEHVAWPAGARYSVAPKVLARRKVLPINERAVLRMRSGEQRWFLVMVGALNVGRIRVVGVEPGASSAAPRAGGAPAALRFERGDELARFEMGSTIVLVLPKGSYRALPELAPGQPLKMGEPIGSC